MAFTLMLGTVPESPGANLVGLPRQDDLAYTSQQQVPLTYSLN